MISEKECLKLLHEKFPPKVIEEYENKIKRDYGNAYMEYSNELSKTLKEYGLGENVEVTIQDIFYYPIIRFGVKIPYKTDMKEECIFINKIEGHMSEFSKKNGLYDFFMNAYLAFR